MMQPVQNLIMLGSQQLTSDLAESQVSFKRRMSPQGSNRSARGGWLNGIQLAELLVVSLLINLSICTQTSLAEARPGHKKPPFNGSIFGKRSMPASGSGPLQSMLLANGGQWPLVGSDANGFDLVAAIQQQDSLIRTTINRCLTRQYDSTGKLDHSRLLEDLIELAYSSSD